jgi:hypothetical protein
VVFVVALGRVAFLSVLVALLAILVALSAKIVA